MADEQMSMAEYVKTRDLTMAILATVANQKNDDGWKHTRYTVRINRHMPGHTNQLITSWSAGTGITEAPTVVDVMDSLRSDAQSYADARNFEDWATDFGYDTDSRAAEKIYNTCGEISRNLTDLLGEEDYLVLLESVEPE